MIGQYYSEDKWSPEHFSKQNLVPLPTDSKYLGMYLFIEMTNLLTQYATLESKLKEQLRLTT